MVIRSPEQRARQAALIRRWRPWERSTGPKTPRGKARVARNAYKGGLRGQLRSLGRVLRAQASRLLALSKQTIG
jgi:hypothetical protein